MKAVTMILGKRMPCIYCGARIRWVLVPAMGDRQHPYEDFEGTPEILERHDCPKHPSKNVAPEPVRSELRHTSGPEFRSAAAGPPAGAGIRTNGAPGRPRSRDTIDRDARVLHALAGRRMTRDQLAAELDLRPSAVHLSLCRLRDAGRVVGEQWEGHGNTNLWSTVD